MASAMFILDRLAAGTMELPTARGRYNVQHMTALARQSLATDAVGTVNVSFSGVKAGSEIKLFDQVGELLAGVESAAGTPAFVLSRFSDGSPNNDVRVLIISLSYEVLDFVITLTSANTNIPVFQRKDRNYRNPT